MSEPLPLARSWVGPASSAETPRSPALVGRVEAAGEQRVEEREHERPVVAPGPRRLAMRPGRPEPHLADRGRGLELVRHANGIADEVAHNGAGEPVPELGRAWG